MISTTKDDDERLRLLESVILNTTDGVLIAENTHNFESQIVFVNEAFMKMSGFAKEEIIGRSPLTFFANDASVDELARLKESIEKFESCNIVVKASNKSGAKYWINLSVAPVSDTSGGYKHWVYIQRDVNNKRRHLQALEVQNKKLKEIAWIQSHVVRAPLARIMGLVELLSERHDSEDLSNNQIIEAIASSANELDNIIRKIVLNTENVQNQSGL